MGWRLIAGALALGACTDDLAAAARYRTAFCTDTCRMDPTLAGCRACADAGTGAQGGGTGGGSTAGGGGGGGGGDASGGGGGTIGPELEHLFIFGLDAGVKATLCTPVRLGVVDVHDQETTFPERTVTLVSAFYDPTCLVQTTGPITMPTGGLPLALKTSGVGGFTAIVDGRAAGLGDLIQPIGSWGQLAATLFIDGGTCVQLSLTARVPGTNQDAMLATLGAGRVRARWADAGDAPLYGEGSCTASDPDPQVESNTTTFWVMHDVLGQDELVIEGPWLHPVYVNFTSSGSVANGQSCLLGEDCMSSVCSDRVCQCIAPNGSCNLATACCTGTCGGKHCP